jgi:hypothetical protein
MKVKKIFTFLIISLALVEGVEIESLHDKEKIYHAGKIISLDFKLTNPEENPCLVTGFIDENPDFKPLFSSRSFLIEPNQEKIITLYLKIDPKKIAGLWPILCKFDYNGNTFIQEIPVKISKTTAVKLANHFFNQKNVILEIQNDSNHAVEVLKEKIPPFSNRKIPYQFTHEYNPGYYSDAIEIKDENETIKKFNINSITIKRDKPKPKNEEFLFPINYGTAYSNQKSKNSLTFYTNGGGYFSENQKLNFKFSIPFFHKNDPYLFYDPEAAIFYLDYKYRNLTIRLGDSYYKNNSILYYSYGRGYSVEYSEPENLLASLSYVTKNSFYPKQDKTLLFNIAKNGSQSVYYHSIYNFSKYSQNLGYAYSSNPKLRGKIEAYNTDFVFTPDHLGILGEFNLKFDQQTADFHIDYLGDKFDGRSNSEFKVIGNYNYYSKEKKQGMKLTANYFDLFPRSQQRAQTIGAKASYNSFFLEGNHNLTFDYSNYNNDDLLRNNYSLYYSLNQRFDPAIFLKFDQGFTYTYLSPHENKQGIRSYTNLVTSYHKGRWNLSLGAKSQVRFFSDTLKPENGISLMGEYNFNRTKASINFNFTNSTFSYKPSIALHYQTGYKMMDIALDYQLIPTFKGYDYRGLVKINFLNYLHIKKPEKTIARFYDINTQKIIDGLQAKTAQNEWIKIAEGSPTHPLSTEELENFELADFKIQRKKKRATRQNVIENEYTFHVDFRGVINGKFNFVTDRPRKAIQQLVLNQSIRAEDEQGNSYPGKIYSDGTFFIGRLKQGTYKIFLSSDDLPDNIQIGSIETTIDYQNPIKDINLKITY